ncbi:ribonucleases P/MRP protein subunit POP1 isoform X2 [Typha latifolia]
MPPERSKPAPNASSSTPPPPPRTLNVQKFAESRASELESLHSIVSDRLGGDFRIQRGKRRRTTGHRVARSRRRAKRQKVGDGGGGEGKASGKEGKVSRRARRSKEMRSNPELGFTTAGDGTKRLRTHLWHAKRFAMMKRWGFYLPLGLQGRGRGSRAVLKWLKVGAVAHDTSYSLPIQLEGPEGSLKEILGMVLHPSHSGKLEIAEDLSQLVLRGVCFENALLYHAGPHSQLVAPVIYMWRPSFKDDNYVSTEQSISPDGCSSVGRKECINSVRQLWIWIHAAAFDEGLNALRSACEKQMLVSGISVSCNAHEGRIARLELMGAKATQFLQKILHPISKSQRTSEDTEFRNSVLNAFTSSHLQNDYVLDLLQSNAILSLMVHDPREVPCQGTEPACEVSSASHEKILQEEDNLDSNAMVSGDSLKNKEILSTLWSNPENHDIFLSDGKTLWDSSSRINPPIPEDIICRDKHQRRLELFHLNSTNNGRPAIEESFSRSCPILLLKHAEVGQFLKWWSIIVPLSWVKPFWFSLVSGGANAIGLRERRWIACNNGLPCFPHDFPDCKAYSLFMASEAAAFDRAAELRPLAFRPPRVPIPSPWDSIAASTDKGPDILRGFKSLDVKSSLTVASFQMFIPRTLKSLNQYLEDIHEKHLLSSNMETSLSEMVGNRKPDYDSGSFDMVLAGKELCLVRVLLHAHKEGVFEDGAIICAPVLADFASWKVRSEKEEDEYQEQWQLQLPQSYIGSYFTQVDSGKWELQLPKDEASQQSFRWPIGFITTGFVHGSSKPVAEAFCESNLLSFVRRQQWSQTQSRRPEIFVLVRNMRSASYRRAIARVVIELQNDDLQFM